MIETMEINIRVYWNVTPYSLVVGSFYHTTRRHTPQDCNPNFYRRKDFTSHLWKYFIKISCRLPRIQFQWWH
jgi:hypothetical protein